MRIQSYIPYSISIENETPDSLSQMVTASLKPLSQRQMHAHFDYPTYAPLVEERTGVDEILDERPDMWNLVLRLE